MADLINGTFRPDSGELLDEHISSSTEVDADKLEHLHKCGTNFDLAIGGTVASREEIVYVASAAATVRIFKCVCNVGGTTGNSDFDLKKNGTTILSAVVNFDNGDPDGTPKSGTISSATLAAGDILSIEVTRNASHDGTGPFAWVELTESPA